ncbi:MAG: choice-of-anchor L domain-containing protein [Opitutales bacterium]
MKSLQTTHILGLSALILLTHGASAALSVSSQTASGATATDFANSLTGAGSGITIQTATGPADSNTIGTFTGGTSAGLPFNTGVVLSSGNVVDAVGPNSLGDTTTNTSNPNTGGANDVASLLLEFIPTNDVVSFQYVFGSEEYNEFVNSQFNDRFQLLLNGVNIALIPGGGGPVTVNNVNNGSNASYFTDNTSGLLNIEYDGLVGANSGFPLSAQGTVIPGALNTLEFIVGDVSDSILDSAVFIAGGSFFDENPDDNPGISPVPEPSFYIGCSLLLGFAGARLRRKAIQRQS